MCIWNELSTCELVLIVAPSWRSTLTTLEWPNPDAAIRAVIPSCGGNDLYDAQQWTLVVIFRFVTITYLMHTHVHIRYTVTMSQLILKTQYHVETLHEVVAWAVSASHCSQYSKASYKVMNIKVKNSTLIKFFPLPFYAGISLDIMWVAIPTQRTLNKFCYGACALPRCKQQW